MRRKRVIVLAVALAFAGAACKRRSSSNSTALRSVVLMSDPHSAGQLLSGFHDVEAGAWRWTERTFSIRLARPRGAEQKGAMLSVKLTVPPVTIDKLKSVQLSASVNGTTTDAETYSAPGDYVYRRELPPGALATDPVRVNFTLDKAIPPGNPDVRQLGIVVLAIGLEPR